VAAHLFEKVFDNSSDGNWCIAGSATRAARVRAKLRAAGSVKAAQNSWEVFCAPLKIAAIQRIMDLSHFRDRCQN
jgi:hypothetical protein